MVGGKALLGFRVPTIVASPWTRSLSPLLPRVDSGVYDHTSILKLIEWRFGLAPLTPRDASNDVANIAEVFDFHHPRYGVPFLPRPTAPPPSPCMAATGALEEESHPNEWRHLLDAGLFNGWPFVL